MNVETVVMNFWRIAMNSGFVDMDLRAIDLNGEMEDIKNIPIEMESSNDTMNGNPENTLTRM